jgi:hypothetical protein
MTKRLVTAVAVALIIGGGAARAAVFCQRRSGALFVRQSCKKHETPVDLATLGMIGPKGDPGAPGEARAYGCSNASGDGTLVTACADRPSKNIVSIVGSTTQGGGTCFVLDPSVPSASAVVLASFNGNVFFGTKVNVLVYASGDMGPAFGCPPNSVFVLTGQWDYVGGVAHYALIRLAVNVAVM